MINSIQSDPNPPDPNNHPIPNRQKMPTLFIRSPKFLCRRLSSRSGHPSTDVMAWAPAVPVP
jgi:hypothetical protein